MLERVLENWLINASEKALQVPFCQALVADGYMVAHVSRHCGMELGKDILAVAPDGVPCAFQLKAVGGGKLSLSRWRNELQAQIYDLAMGRLVHPSLPSGLHHRSYVVINGELEEEVIRAIDDFNTARRNEGNPHCTVETIVKGQLTEKFLGLGIGLWPIELVDVRTMLELYLADGGGQLPKEKLGSFLERTMGLDGRMCKPLTPRKLSRQAASGALMCELSLAQFRLSANHAAEFEAWTMYLAHMFAATELAGQGDEGSSGTHKLVSSVMFNALADLCDELIERGGNYEEGDRLADGPVWRVRITYLVGLMSVYGLWLESAEGADPKHSTFVRAFCLENAGKIVIWGEYAVPQILACYFYLLRIDSGKSPDAFLGSVLDAVVGASNGRTGRGLPNPYYGPEDVLPWILGVDKAAVNETFVGQSYSLESLFHILVRRNWKQKAKTLWPEVSKVAHVRYESDTPWGYYRWKMPRMGVSYTTICNPTQRWEDMRRISEDSSGVLVPASFKLCPLEYLAFLVVYPHRLNSSGAKWLYGMLVDKRCGHD